MDSKNSSNPEQESINNASAELPTLEPDDYYFDGQQMVFTAKFLLKFGSCCHCGCRHCPYGNAEASSNEPANTIR